MRRQSREIALQILFQIEFAAQIEYSEFLEVFEQSYDQETLDFADLLITGVKENKEKIDSLITSSGSHWSLSRMAIVDRNILRIAIFETKILPDPIKPSIAINEAIELAKKFSTTESAGFVNGVLDQVTQT
ncbi:MAG: transcription antitermination factor NusB [Proteobacteria bacterium]|jgi:N utilization substance protein B|nr:transcription antitermination factor NusB [Pseudomonadota bacterium]